MYNDPTHPTQLSTFSTKKETVESLSSPTGDPGGGHRHKWRSLVTKFDSLEETIGESEGVTSMRQLAVLVLESVVSVHSFLNNKGLAPDLVEL